MELGQVKHLLSTKCQPPFWIWQPIRFYVWMEIWTQAQDQDSVLHASHSLLRNIAFVYLSWGTRSIKEIWVTCQELGEWIQCFPFLKSRCGWCLNPSGPPKDHPDHTVHTRKRTLYRRASGTRKSLSGWGQGMRCCIFRLAENGKVDRGRGGWNQSNFVRDID